MRRWKIATAGIALAGAAVTGTLVAGTFRLGPEDEVRLAALDRLDGLDGVVEHYAQAERELAAADVADLAPDRREARERLLAELRAYRTARDFGRNVAGQDLRAHLFVDGDGRRCAVAQLLHVTGEDRLVEEIAASNNGAFVADLAGDARFHEWLDRVGLTIEEAARIQAPAVEPPTGEIGGPSTTSQPETNAGTPTATPEDTPGRPSGGTPQQGPTTPPGGNTSGGPTTGGSTSGGGTGGPTSPGGGGGIGRSPRTGSGTVSNRPLASVGAEAWSTWWEFEKLTWMRPARDRLEPATVTGAAKHDPDADLVRRRADAVERLVPLLAHKDPAVRGAAAVALGRLGGAAAVDRLLPLLADEKPFVRDRAVLALGATGDARAAERLLAIANGTLEEAPTISARHLAIVALGVARRHGLRTDPGAEIAALLDRAKARGEEPLADAAAMFATVSRSDAVVRRLQDVADEPAAHSAVRGRALEALPPKTDATTIRILQKALGSRDADVRRSAAVALGGVGSPLVAPHLMTAAELETDGLARGLLLVSIARQGGVRAEGFVSSALADRDDALRPWAALGLAVLARDHGSERARTALGTASLRSMDAGALWIAKALAGDAGVAEECIAALDEGDARRRAYAATALSLVPGDESAAALRTHAADEAEDVPAVALAVAVGLRGDPADAPLLLAAGRKFRPEWLRAPLAMALGLHRTRATVDGLLDVLSSPRSSAVQLAVSADAIGVALDAVPEPVLPAVGRSTNFAAIPDWLLAALRSTL